jgi:CDP-6-deoxy-D-xylo-4-hexulose-3-dehydrase
MENNIRKDISEFLNTLKHKYGSNIPRFLHNLEKFDNKILYSGAHWDDNEPIAAIEALLFSGWSINGNYVAQFEKEFAKKINEKECITVNSGSSANLVMFAALKKYFKWEDGSEVIVSCASFPTSVAPIPQNQLKAVFVDIELSSLNFDLDEVEKKITPKTKAILISPVLSNAPDYDRLISIRDKYNVLLISDNCDSTGSKYKGKYFNEYTFCSSYSFFSSHHLSLIQAGAISSNNSEFINICRNMIMWSRNCTCLGEQNLLKYGMCKKRWSNWLKDSFPGIITDHKYFFTERGFNVQILEFQGAIGLEQLKKWDFIHSSRKNNKEYIQKLFEKYIPDIKHPNVLPDTDISWFGVPLICQDYTSKQKIVKYLNDNNINTREYFSGNILAHPGYSDLGDYRLYPNSNEILKRIFFIGSAPFYTQQHLDYIEEVLKKYEE